MAFSEFEFCVRHPNTPLVQLANGWTCRQCVRDNELIAEAADADAIIPLPGGAKTSPCPELWRAPWLNFSARLAATCAEGDSRYGERQWESGLGSRDYALERASHLLQHVIRAVDEFRRGVRTKEDHLAHAMWNIQFLMAAQEKQGHKQEEDKNG